MLVRPPIGENIGPDVLNFEWLMWNRTGAAVAPGTLLFTDAEFTQAESTSNVEDHPGFFMKQGVLTSTTSNGLNQNAFGMGGFVQNSTNVADNALATVRIAGMGNALVLSSQAGNPALARGNKCIPIAGSPHTGADATVALGANTRCVCITAAAHAGGASALLTRVAITSWFAIH